MLDFRFEGIRYRISFERLWILSNIVAGWIISAWKNDNRFNNFFHFVRWFLYCERFLCLSKIPIFVRVGELSFFPFASLAKSKSVQRKCKSYWINIYLWRKLLNRAFRTIDSLGVTFTIWHIISIDLCVLCVAFDCSCV